MTVLLGRIGDTSGSPYIEGQLFIPRFRVRSNVSFLVDTGADSTTLLPSDALKLGLNYGDLVRNPNPTIGIGGRSHNFLEEAVIAFTATGTAAFYYRIQLEIVEYDDDLMMLPSLLGRDVLRNWRMRYSPPTSRLTFHVISSHQTIALDSP